MSRPSSFAMDPNCFFRWLRFNLSTLVSTTRVGAPRSARNASIWWSSFVGPCRASTSWTTPWSAGDRRRYVSMSGFHFPRSSSGTLA